MKCGDCFRVQASYGDARPSWWVYRRVRRQIAGWVECHRFETRCDEMHLMYPADPIPVEVLEQHEPLSEIDWLIAWNRWSDEVSEPWNVE